MNSGVIVSVLVTTYNPKWKELERTLKSILYQKDISFEIVISDDGSVNPLDKDIKLLFGDYNFACFEILTTANNMGTVFNINRGLEKCKGKYIKLISPGDFLFDEYSLKHLVNTAEKESSEFVFGNVLYYDDSKSVFTPIKHMALPQFVDVYKKNDKKRLQYNYLILNDNIHGVSTLIEKKLLKKYIGMIVGKIKYTEDSVYRIMIIEGVKMSFCNKNVVCYAFGGGISTNENLRWKELIRKDLVISDNIIKEHKREDSSFIRQFNASLKFRDYPSLHNKVLFALSSPKAIFAKMAMALPIRKTTVLANDTFINEVF